MGLIRLLALKHKLCMFLAVSLFMTFSCVGSVSLKAEDLQDTKEMTVTKDSTPTTVNDQLNSILGENNLSELKLQVVVTGLLPSQNYIVFFEVVAENGTIMNLSATNYNGVVCGCVISTDTIKTLGRFTWNYTYVFSDGKLNPRIVLWKIFILEPDNELPTITAVHAKINNKISGSSVTISATVDDNQNIDFVYINYSADGSTWNMLLMTVNDSVATIELEVSEDIEFTIIAYDLVGNSQVSDVQYVTVEKNEEESIVDHNHRKDVFDQLLGIFTDKSILIILMSVILGIIGSVTIKKRIVAHFVVEQELIYEEHDDNKQKDRIGESKGAIVKKSSKLPSYVEKHVVSSLIHQFLDDVDGTKNIEEIAHDLDVGEEMIKGIELFLEKIGVVERIGEDEQLDEPVYALKEVLVRVQDTLPPIFYKKRSLAVLILLVHKTWNAIDGTKSIEELALSLNLKKRIVEYFAQFLEKYGLVKRETKEVKDLEFGESVRILKEVIVKVQDKFPSKINNNRSIANMLNMPLATARRFTHKLWDSIDSLKDIQELSEKLNMNEDSVKKITALLEKKHFIRREHVGIASGYEPSVVVNPKLKKKVLIKLAFKFPKSIYKNPKFARLLKIVWERIDGTKSRQEIMKDLRYSNAAVEKVINYMIENSLIEEEELPDEIVYFLG